jgi:hypothetical protein
VDAALALQHGDLLAQGEDLKYSVPTSAEQTRTAARREKTNWNTIHLFNMGYGLRWSALQRPGISC